MWEIKDGDLYKKICLDGVEFEIYYGYYEDYERESEYSEPIPIYPSFEREAVYGDSGCPFVTQMQSLCQYGDSKFQEGCCVDCSYFCPGEDLIGLCKCPKRRLQ